MLRPMPKKPAAPRSRAPKDTRSDLLAVLLREREREIIAEYLGKHAGSVAATAEALGIKRRALEIKMLAYGLRESAAVRRRAAGIKGPR